MQTGKIGVTTENIFPIIKKFLYSDHEIFLRELISNAIDATQKLKKLSSLGEVKGDLGDLTIHVKLDKKKKTLTISDRGIGMTEEEVDKYINQIAFSSAGEFINKFKDQTTIIGKFGLGFYSSFMVSKKVEIVTLSHQEGAKAVKWSCDGSPEYNMEEAKKTDRGTDITLFIDDESIEFADESRIKDLLNKYCRFLPIEIAFGKEKEWKEGKEVETDKDKIINDTNPLWAQKPTELKDEDYRKFYDNLYPFKEEPLFHIHLNVDYPFNLTGILYFPKIKNNIEVQKNKIQLYANQVFVTDSVEGIVPEFLTLLHGVLDSPDIPLNVSRSYLQSDSNVKKISNHITKKVGDRLEEIFKNDRLQFEQKWDNLKIFIEYGMLTEEKFYEKAIDFVLLKNTDGKYFTLEEYEKLIKENQTDKSKTLVYLYSTDREKQYTFIENAKAKGYDVLLMDGQLDTHFINQLEQKLKDTRFMRVDSDVVEKLIKKDDIVESHLSDEEKNQLSKMFESQLPSFGSFTVQFENMNETDEPVVITQSEFMRRMRDMAAMSGGMNFYGDLPDSYNLVINSNHKLLAKIIEQKDKKLGTKISKLIEELNPLEKEKEEISKKQTGKKEEEINQVEKDKFSDVEKKIDALVKQKNELLETYGKENKLVKQLIDLALLANNMLKGEDLTKFVKRSVDLIK
ncbi:MAG: molecular chaperone HtpG [Bacteroidetes bacterium GWF2_33_16]|nr:MAG: molecular chaperone HtpG [Bacteroidetes bacterium GWE2_32_14]OFY06453.1 MAG: molecular chaperone HtpG [Bacteroidetes bacterium GWF2_33_16]